ncbi:acrylyl-CoA reductase family protein [Mycolicibacterium baixiangningiae]|uniref:acrylyl-CoA reductase family protein n=1 Tax=Mycolicibacterium baixiangningiae TaxID=2761578 RepID=UPI0018689FAE|nr:acryloyl-CoA reductase [Mycolicibacterium baixiangningiae]
MSTTASYKAFQVGKDDSGEFYRDTREVTAEPLADGEVRVRVAWSSINYKDGLASTAEGRVARISPLIPGIDLAGEVVDPGSSGLTVGDQVLAHGYELGVARHGGFSQYATVPAGWVVPRPAALDARHAMVTGTAGFTAALSVAALRDGGISPDLGPVLVTGATGGVGSFAVTLLSNLGYDVVASTGRRDREDWLKSLGAGTVIDRLPADAKPLGKETWAGVVDSVGGSTLHAALASTCYGGIVAASGNTGGPKLGTTVFPFILRGVRLHGIDSVACDIDRRRTIWHWIADTMHAQQFDALAGRVVGLSELPEALDAVLAGRALGRTLVQLERV